MPVSKAPTTLVQDFQDGEDDRRDKMEKSRDDSSSKQVIRAIKVTLYVSLFLALWSVTMRFQVSPSKADKFVSVFPVYYRAIALLVLGGWCWGFNIQGLDRFHIDYCTLFDMDLSTKITSRTVYCTASLFTVVLLANIVTFTQARGIPSTFIPLCLYISMLLLLCWPKSPFHNARYALLQALQSVMLSPFTGVAFVHVILADLLTSYSKVFADMYGTVCVISNSTDRHFHASILQACRNDPIGPIVASLPSWLRLFQCLKAYSTDGERRHLLNALKYSTAFPVLFFSYLKQGPSAEAWGPQLSQLWLLSVFVNSLYSFYWDIYYDWGLGSISSSNLLLRDRLVFPKRWWYYATMVTDLLLRFTWSLQLSPHWWFIGSVGREFKMFVLEAVEIFRRCMWIFFRCEWQHISHPIREDKGHPRMVPDDA
uniref:EXS domain-containing protein n=1 Tax=Eutreptiella gymnastica TaxID=73025 RepID=A0A7S1IAN5_9EUGL